MATFIPPTGASTSISAHADLSRLFRVANSSWNSWRDLFKDFESPGRRGRGRALCSATRAGTRLEARVAGAKCREGLHFPVAAMRPHFADANRSETPLCARKRLALEVDIPGPPATLKSYLARFARVLDLYKRAEIPANLRFLRSRFQ